MCDCSTRWLSMGSRNEDLTLTIQVACQTLKLEVKLLLFPVCWFGVGMLELLFHLTNSPELGEKMTA